MKLTDMNKKPTLKDLQANLVERFNLKIDLDDYSLNQLIEMFNKLEAKTTKLMETNSADYVHKNEYQKNKLFMQIIETEISVRKKLVEGAEDKAELVMVAKNMVDKVTGWLEDTAEMQTQSMLELADGIRDELGADTSQQYKDAVKPGLEALYAAMEQTREALVAGVGVVSGEGGAVAPMGAPAGGADLGAEMGAEPALDTGLEGPGAADDADLEADEFSASAAAAGGEEPADRTRRESVDLSRRLGMIMSEGYGKKKKKKKKSYEGRGMPEGSMKRKIHERNAR